MELTLNQPRPYIKRLSVFDWLFAIALLSGAAFALSRYGAWMTEYDKGVLIAVVPVLSWLGWSWKPVRLFVPIAFALGLLGVYSYHGDLGRAEHAFFLKFFVSSQVAIMWMCALYAMATISYWAGLLGRSSFAAKTGTALTWSAATMGLTGLLVRWYESYLIGTDVGHIPISNLYEVFVLFTLITALLYLYYEGRYQQRSLGAFVLLVITAAVGFILWYSFDRQAQGIQPLVPALQSWWMKIHVPANFIGYGSFSISAMVSIAWLLGAPIELKRETRRTFAGASLALFFVGLIILVFTSWHPGFYWFVWTISVLLAIAASQGLVLRLRSVYEIAEDWTYKSIAIGFVFFTIATILGAMWAAEAWGGYWSWDPKETWALIVWLNYAAWLHLRMVKGLRGMVLAWWAVVGLLVTTFAFLGVNMFLSGLHSYGTL